MLSYHKKLAWNKRKKPVVSKFFKEKGDLNIESWCI